MPRRIWCPPERGAIAFVIPGLTRESAFLCKTMREDNWVPAQARDDGCDLCENQVENHPDSKRPALPVGNTGR
jgi:hypothetical protein